MGPHDTGGDPPALARIQGQTIPFLFPHAVAKEVAPPKTLDVALVNNDGEEQVPALA